ncbi:MAG: hypothetical protein JSR82_08520 [Verrucomicrobia bacterium]|nr:hypothetical protein [Verrucomicrobiota bacterium]
MCATLLRPLGAGLLLLLVGPSLAEGRSRELWRWPWLVDSSRDDTYIPAWRFGRPTDSAFRLLLADFRPPLVDAVTSSGDATVFPPGSTGSGLAVYAGRTGVGSINVDGGITASFFQVYLGATQSGFTTTPAGHGTLTISGTGTIVGSNQIFAGGPGTGIIVVDSGASLLSTVQLSGASSALTLDTASFTGSLAAGAGAQVSMTNSTFVGGLELTATDGTLSGGLFGHATNFAASSLRLGSVVGRAATFAVENAATVDVGEVVIGVAQPDVAPLATLQVDTGSTFRATNLRIGQIGDQTFGRGYVLIEGSTTQVVVRNLLEVGGQAAGEFEVRNGATVTTERFHLNGGLGVPFPSRFDLRVGSQLTVGTELLLGRGFGTVRELSTLQTNAIARIGVEAQLGYLELDGGYFVANAGVSIGYRGNGEVFVRDQFTVLPTGVDAFSAPAVTLGDGLGARGKLTIGADVNATIGALTIGTASGTGSPGGSGLLVVEDGGRLRGTTANIANFTAPEGSVLSEVRLTGAGSRWDVGMLNVGQAGATARSAVTVGAGATLATTHALIGQQASFVSVEGGTWTNTGLVDLGGYNLPAGNLGGAIYVSQNGVFATNQLTVGSPDPSSSSSGLLSLTSGGTAALVGPLLVGPLDENSGVGGNGTVRISGGVLTTPAGANIGLSPEGVGPDFANAVILENGGVWNLGDHLVVGDGVVGRGRIRVNAGGALSLGNYEVVFGRGAYGALSLVGGSATASSFLVFGEQGRGDLVIEAGGRLVTNDTIFGQNGATPTRSASSGFATITGTGGAVPGFEWIEQGSVTIGLGGDGSVTLQTDARVRVAGETILASAAGTQGTLRVLSLSYWQNTGQIEVGRGGSGTLEISGGARVQAAYAIFGNEAGSSGAGTVTGSITPPVGGPTRRSTFDLAGGDLTVGNRGQGGLAIIDQAQVFSGDGTIGASAGANGAVSLERGGEWTLAATLVVGDRGTGTLDLLSGSLVQNGSAVLGQQAGGAGSATLRELSAWVNRGFVLIGSAGQGNVSISGGASLAATSASIATGAGSVGSVLVSERVSVVGPPEPVRSTFRLTEDLEVGGSGNGSLTIAEFGLVSGRAGVLGARPSSVGTVEVRTGGEWRLSGGLTVGAEGNGTLTIRSGGLVAAEDGARIGRNAGVTGTVTVMGAQAGVLAQFNYGTGQLNLGEDGTGNATMGTDGAFTGQTVVLGVGPTGRGTATITDGLWTNRAAFVVGGFGVGAVNQTFGRVETVDLVLGRDLGGSGNYDLSNPLSALYGVAVSGTTTIGGAGTGTFTISDGGRLTSGATRLGDAASGVGTLTLRDAASVWSPGVLTVGVSGRGTVDLQAGTSTNVPGITLGLLGGSRGDLLLTNATLVTGLDVIAGAAGRGVIMLDGDTGPAGSTLLNAAGLVLGQSASGRGEFTTDGPGARVELAGSLVVGDRGVGTLELKNGAVLVQDDPAQRLTIASDLNATGDLILRSGAMLQSNATVTLDLGAARLQLTSGASATFAGGLRLGADNSFNASSTALVDLGGTGTTLTADFTVLRGRGLNELKVHDGAVLSTNALTVGFVSGQNVLVPEFRNTVTIAGAGSRLTTNNGFVTVGNGVFGQIVLRENGLLQSGPANIGITNGGAGQVLLTSGARWDAGNVVVSSTSGALSLLSISDGARMTAGQVRVGGGFLGAGFEAQLVVDGLGNASVATFLDVGTLFIGSPIGASGGPGRGTVLVARNGLLQTASGIFVEENGALYSNNGGAIRSGVTNRGGLISGNQGRLLSLATPVQLSAQQAQTPSVVAAFQPTLFTIEGAYLQQAGILAIAAAGPGAGQFDTLTVTGGATFNGGTIQLDFVDGYLPRTGDTFRFLIGPSASIASGVAFTYTGAEPGFLFNVQVLPDGSLEFKALNNAIPEPGASVLLTAAGLILLRCRRRGR